MSEFYALYVAEGRFVPGVPARHLTRDEWEEFVGVLSPEERKLCEEIYQIQKPKMKVESKEN